MKRLLLLCCGLLFLFDIWYITQKYTAKQERDSILPSINLEENETVQTNALTVDINQQQHDTTVVDTLPIVTSQPEIQTLEQMFEYIDPMKVSAERSKPNEYTIIATGDVIPARSVNAAMVRRDNFTFPFEKTVGVLKSADAVFINLESPLVSGCQVTTSGMSFCGDPRAVEGFTYAGVSVASIANNHAGNYGLSGITQTVEALKVNKIGVTGNGESATVTIRGKKFGFLGYNAIGSREQGLAWADDTSITKDIQTLKKYVDFVLVAFHWGVEYTSTPSATQRKTAHAAIDAGADLIIGNHPHWVQGVERYKGKHITYAHGNYIFDQMWSTETREGVLGKYVFSDSGLIRVQFVPIVIDDYSEARYATESEAKQILSRMSSSTVTIRSSEF